MTPKAVLFDIGGVCVLSPFQAILDYENKNHIPTDWINYAISRAAPNGAWQRLERGEIKLDETFFERFNDDLHNPVIWEDYHSTFRNSKKALKDVANPTQLGDPVSLKAESADSSPTDQDRGAAAPTTDSSSGDQGANLSPRRDQDEGGRKRLKDLANPTQLGDPVSLKAESADSSPTDQDRGAGSDSNAPRSPSAHNSTKEANEPKRLKDLANPSRLGDPISLKAETADSSPTSNDRGAQSSSSGSPVSRATSSSSGSAIPPLPTIDATSLFWEMMAASRSPDPYIYPALQRLRSTGKFIIGALSNTVTFPPDHPYTASQADLRSNFDIFVSSSEIGMRKPQREIYEYAIAELDRFAQTKGKKGTGSVKAGDVVFLDDIGQNLKMGREVGMVTVRVRLGKTWRAVKELEKIVGVELMDERTRRAKL